MVGKAKNIHIYIVLIVVIALLIMTHPYAYSWWLSYDKEDAVQSINEDAPVRASAEIEISAEPEEVWDVVTDFDRWPEWNGDVTWVTFEGEVKPGSQFQWKAGPGKIKSTLHYMDKPRLLVWKGKTLGIKAIHVWRIMPYNNGTLLITRESWQGFVVRLFHRSLQKKLQQSIDTGLKYLKDEAESRLEP
jgi:hypothetical protein